MMEPVDQLLTIAEIGAAFAGFTAIAGVVLVNAEVKVRSQINFWIMIEFSFALIIFSLIPVVLFNLNVSEPAVWSLSSASMALFIPAHIFGVGARFIMPAIRRGEFTATGPWGFVPLFLLVFSVQSANALGVGFEKSFGAYFLGLSTFILLVFTNFVSLLRQIWLGSVPHDA